MVHIAICYLRCPVTFKFGYHPAVTGKRQNVSIERKNPQVPVAQWRSHLTIMHLLVRQLLPVQTQHVSAGSHALGMTPLHHAASRRREDVVELLVKRLGADIGALSNDLLSVLHFAA